MALPAAESEGSGISAEIRGKKLLAKGLGVNKREEV